MPEDHSTTIPEDSWEVVQEETATRIIFDTLGEAWIGAYVGHDIIQNPNDPDETFDYLMFRGTDNNLYSMSAGYQLKKAFEKIDEGSIVRITYIKDVDMGPGRNAMKDYRVEVKAR